MQEVVGSNPTEGKISFSQFTLFYRVKCEKLFCKTNLKLKVFKIIKQKLALVIFLTASKNTRMQGCSGCLIEAIERQEEQSFINFCRPQTWSTPTPTGCLKIVHCSIFQSYFANNKQMSIVQNYYYISINLQNNKNSFLMPRRYLKSFDLDWKKIYLLVISIVTENS